MAAPSGERAAVGSVFMFAIKGIMFEVAARPPYLTLHINIHCTKLMK